MKYLEDLLQAYEKNIQPYGNNLIELLINMFFQYSENISNQSQLKSQQNLQKSGKKIKEVNN